MDKLELALKRFDTSSEFWNRNNNRGDEDGSFAYGNQWEEQIKSEREAERRPCLTENRVLPFIHQVVNEARQQRPKIRPVPSDDKADVEIAKILAGVIRNIEKCSDAESAYDTAVHNSVSRNVGYILIRTDYSSPDSFEQEIKIERVLNPSSVMIDPSHKNLDGSDIEYAFVFEDMDIEEFRESYPDSAVSSLDASSYDNDWIEEGKVRVAEYYYKDYKTKTLVELVTGEVGYKDEFEDLEDEMILRSRDVEVPTIKWCKITGKDILEETDILGKYIPVVPVIGEEAFINGRREFYSLIHQAKDPQKMLNIWKSASTEIIGLQPKASYVGAVGQFDTYAKHWSQSNVKNFPFLQYDIVYDENGVPLPAPQRQMPPQGSGSMMQEAMASAEAIKSCLGMYDASAGEQTSDVSGKAIIARQLKGDNATFHFIDNLATALKQVGRILVDLIPYIYSEKTILKILGEDDQERLVPINQPVIKEGNDYRAVKEGEYGEKVISFDVGKYDIDIDVGASYATKRQEQANAIIELARVNPDVLSIAGDLFVKSLDIPMAQEIAERIQSTMNPELLGDDPQAEVMKKQAKAIEQLKAQLEQTESALLAKNNNEQLDNQIKIEELKLKREELQLKATQSMGQLNNERIKVEAEAFKDIAEGQEAMRGELDDVRQAVELILDKGMATGKPEVPETEVEITTGEEDEQ